MKNEEKTEENVQNTYLEKVLDNAIRQKQTSPGKYQHRVAKLNFKLGVVLNVQFTIYCTLYLVFQCKTER